MTRTLIVKRKTLIDRSDLNDPGPTVMERERFGSEAGNGRKFGISGLDRVLGKGRKNIGEEKLLVLLLMIDQPEVEHVTEGGAQQRQSDDCANRRDRRERLRPGLVEEQGYRKHHQRTRCQLTGRHRHGRKAHTPEAARPDRCECIA